MTQATCTWTLQQEQRDPEWPVTDVEVDRGQRCASMRANASLRDVSRA